MNDLITRIVATWPIEIAAMAHAVSVVAPIILALYLLWLAANAVESAIDRAERKRLAKHLQQRSQTTYRTASERQMERDVADLWRRHAGFEDTYPTDWPQIQPTDARGRST